MFGYVYVVFYHFVMKQLQSHIFVEYPFRQQFQMYQELINIENQMKIHSTGHNFNDILFLVQSHTPMQPHITSCCCSYTNRNFIIMYVVCLRHMPNILVSRMQPASGTCQTSCCHICSLPQVRARHLCTILQVTCN